ncbi:hypothetical protein PR202_ga30135 [Eleusine coracana subsp. coracana]|uniref:TF-B3 domain-containing protein n=1 Tax=Eleusine coracana subsp. coracana TaxID=191504 RepID=A0AAV5DN72_ELECO|nr:hypothetical protein PR202_ga30135 [Eleusine coracana subsp. coracana]
MASPGHRPAGAAARKHLRVLLPFSRDRLVSAAILTPLPRKPQPHGMELTPRTAQRIPDELAEDIGAGEALVVGKVKVWSVEVAPDGGGGAFLGRGWPEFADACGAGVGWFLLLRHRGRGVLTVKAFDTTSCLREVGAPPPAAEAMMISNTARKPRFVSVLSADFMEKMLIPAIFVQQYIPKEHLNNHMAIILGTHGKVYSIKLERVQSDMFFAVFGLDGCQRESRKEETRFQQKGAQQQEAPSGSIWKRKQNDIESFQRNSFYKIVPPSWIRKRINTNMLETHLALTTTFCDAIGLREPCMITLKTSMDSNVSWLVHGLPCKTGSYLLVQGWKRFCQENSLREGDICTFNAIKTTLWHVVITRCEENMKQLFYETPGSHSGRSSNERQRIPQGSMTYLNKARTKCSFEIGPPAWVQKEMNATTIQKQLLALAFTLESSTMPPPGNNGAASHKDLRVLLPFTNDSLRIPKELAAELGSGTGEALLIGRSGGASSRSGALRSGGTAAARSWAAGGRSSRRRAAPAWGGSWSSGTGAAACSRSRRSTQAAAAGSLALQLRLKIRQPQAEKRHHRNCSLSVHSHKIPWKRWFVNYRFLLLEQSDSDSLPRPFCDAIGFQEPFMIMLQDSMDSTRFWKVQGYRYNNGSCQLGSGWKSFCRDIRLKEGDILTINVIQTTLWRVDITRCDENQMYHEIPSGSQGEKRPNGSMACLSNSRTRCVFEIGPPTWIRKEINKSTIEKHLFLPAAFCDAIGLQKTCLVTLKSSLYGASSWQVCVSPRKNSSSHCVTSGWKRFFQENDLKVGEVCTFNIVETRLWHVLIQRC